MVMDWYKVDLNQVGLYNIAYRFGNALEMMGEAVGMAVGPQYVKLYTRKDEESLVAARRLTFFLMVVFLSVTFLISLWLKEIFSVLINNASLNTAYGLGIIILMGYSYRPMYWATVNKLGSFDRTNVLWRISFVAGILNLVLNLLFVGSFGVYGAAVITFISLMFIGFSGFHLKSYKKLKGVNHHSVFWLLAVVLVTILVYVIRDIAIIFKLAITGLIGISLFYTVFVKKVFHTASK
jgi:O-antigen/teichoic acid export membrane protein